MLYYLSGARLPSKKAHVIQQVRMCQAFSRAGEEVTLLTPRNPSVTTTWSQLSDFYGLEVPFNIQEAPTLSSDRSIPIPNVPNTDHMGMATWLIYRFLTGRFSPGDIVYSRNPFPTWFFLHAVKASSRRGDIAVWFEQHQPTRGLNDDFYSLLDGLVCISHRQYDLVAQHHALGTLPIHVAHDGVDLSLYEHLSKPAAREQLGIAIDESIVMYTGHLYESKGVETLVSAAHDIDATCYIVGGYEEDIKRIRTTMAIPPNVHFTGFVPPGQVPLYQTAADVLVATVADDTQMEYFSPLKLFEYMATGNPLVVCHRQEYEEFLTNGQTALFVSPEESKELSDAINRLMYDSTLRRRLGERARERVEQYRWEVRASDILGQIRSSNRPPPERATV